MKTISLFITAILLSANLHAQQLLMPADGGSYKAMVGERVGITDVTINYGRPGVKGREGHIWGETVPTGFAGNSKIPWRAGANENTTIEFSTDVLIEGQKLPAGKYGFFIAYDPDQSTLIFSKHNNAWGSFFYNDKEDALRVKIKPVALKENVEKLTYSFTDQTDSSAVVNLSWEKLSFPFHVSTNLTGLQLASFASDFTGANGFNPYSLFQAASYLNDNNVAPDKAMEYINSASNWLPFYLFITKADIYEKTGKKTDADDMMKTAVAATSNPNTAHYYATSLLGKKETQKAFNLFKMNYDKYPDTYVTNTGMARAYSAMGDYKSALKYANKALVKADEKTRTAAETNIKKLKEGKDINS